MDDARRRRVEQLAADPDPLRTLRERVLAIDPRAIAQIAALQSVLDDVGFLLPGDCHPYKIETLSRLAKYLIGDAWLQRQLSALRGEPA
jgi:hypothetical protein